MLSCLVNLALSTTNGWGADGVAVAGTAVGLGASVGLGTSVGFGASVGAAGLGASVGFGAAVGVGAGAHAANATPAINDTVKNFRRVSDFILFHLRVLFVL